MSNAIRIFSGTETNDVVYVTLPLYHTNGGVLALGQMIFNGSAIVLRRKFSATNFWTDCIKEKCTVSPSPSLVVIENYFLYRSASTLERYAAISCLSPRDPQTHSIACDS